MDKVRWGVLSTAKIGRQKVIPAIERSQFGTVTAIASRELAKARAVAEELGIEKPYSAYQQLLSDRNVDAIYIPLPNHLHVRWAIRALEMGKHVLCEKPIGLSVAEAEQLAGVAATKPKLKVMEAFMYRFHPQWQAVRQLVQDGRIGQLRTIQSFFSYYNDDPLSIRKPMKPDGTAGDELADGETGEICFTGPQVFVAYVGNPAAYRQTVSSDGVYYSGDLGYMSTSGLILAGRSKLVIKPKGYLVHPAQVEQHFAALVDDVAACAAVGNEHDLFGEAVVLFVAPKVGRELSRARLDEHAQGIASYMRPTHYVLVEAGGLPLNRTGKTDYVRIKQLAAVEVERLRSLGQWG